MSEAIEVRLPDIGDYQNIPIIEILAKAGDRVEADTPLLSLESDKATMEVPSPVAGTIREWIVEVGALVSMGTTLLTLVPDAASPTNPEPKAEEPAAPEAVHAKAETPAPAKPSSPAPQPPAPQAPVASNRPEGSAHATPSVRALARDLGVDLSRVTPSGDKGRILREDVSSFVKSRLSSPSAPEAAPATRGIGGDLPAWPTVDFAKFGPVSREPLSRIGKISGANLSRNYLTIPHVTNFDKADVTDIEAFRASVNAERRDVKLTMVAFLIKASALALRAYPRFNASLDGDDLVMKDYVHVGFAVDTPKGLMVPVIRDCDRKGLVTIAAEMGALAEKARGGTLSGAEMQGGCFSVSSLGGIGGSGFTPIINAPEVAILGAGRSETQAVWDGAAFRPRLVLPVSLSWDHRVVDGVAAARFLGHVAATLSDLRRAML